MPILNAKPRGLSPKKEHFQLLKKSVKNANQLCCKHVVEKDRGNSVPIQSVSQKKSQLNEPRSRSTNVAGSALNTTSDPVSL